MNDPWPQAEIRSHLDAEQPALSTAEASERLSALGLGAPLVAFLAPLYAAADGATFFDGTLRLYPLAGALERGLPDLAAWNDRSGWVQFEPPKKNTTFYFASNAFGDQLGAPLDEHGALLHDRVGVLWVERFLYQEAKVPWPSLIPRLAREAALANFFLRRQEHDWAAAGPLGKPEPWQCFSSNVPALLGGPDTLDNIGVHAMPVHVSMTLQLLGQAQQRAPLAR